MRLQLIRELKTDKLTSGSLYIDGYFECYTLEDTVRDLGVNCEGKHKDETAIPTGTYSLILSFSNRFQKYMPEILNVPCFTGVRMHSGNRPDDSSGCVLLGTNKTKEGLITGGTSRPAFENLMRKLRVAEKKEKITIEIK